MVPFFLVIGQLFVMVERNSRLWWCAGWVSESGEPLCCRTRSKEVKMWSIPQLVDRSC